MSLTGHPKQKCSTQCKHAHSCVFCADHSADFNFLPAFLFLCTSHRFGLLTLGWKLFFHDTIMCWAPHNYRTKTWVISSAGGLLPVVLVWADREWWEVLQLALICKGDINKGSDSEDKDGIVPAVEQTYRGNKAISKWVGIKTSLPVFTCASCPCITFFP